MARYLVAAYHGFVIQKVFFMVVFVDLYLERIALFDQRIANINQVHPVGIDLVTGTIA